MRVRAAHGNIRRCDNKPQESSIDIQSTPPREFIAPAHFLHAEPGLRPGRRPGAAGRAIGHYGARFRKHIDRLDDSRRLRNVEPGFGRGGSAFLHSGNQQKEPVYSIPALSH
jgi:hypothetical protein